MGISIFVNDSSNQIKSKYLSKCTGFCLVDIELPSNKQPLDLKNLKVIALVQDDKTGEILQAAEVDLGAGKKEK